MLCLLMCNCFLKDLLIQGIDLWNEKFLIVMFNLLISQLSRTNNILATFSFFLNYLAINIYLNIILIVGNQDMWC